MRDSISGWIVGRKGLLLPWLVLAVVLTSTYVVDRHWEDELAGAREAAERQADTRTATLADALGNTLSERLGALAAPRMRFTPVEDAVSERTFAAALDSVTTGLSGLAAVSAAFADGRITRGTDALFNRIGFSPDYDT